MKKFHLNLLFTFLSLAMWQTGVNGQCDTPPAGLVGAGNPVKVVSVDFESGLGIFSQSAADDFDWSVNSGGTTSFGTGPSGANCPDNTGNYLYTETSFPQTNGDVATIEATVDLSALAAGDAAIGQLYYNANGTCIGTLVYSLNGGAATAINPGTNQGDNWIEAEMDLSAFAGGTVDLALTYTIPNPCPAGSAFNSDMAIDGFAVWAFAPPCILTCGPAINASVDPGACEANLTIPNPTFNANCITVAPVVSFDFNAGIPAGWNNAAIGANAGALWMNGDGTVGNAALTVDGSDLMFFDDDDFEGVGDGGDIAQITTANIDLSGQVSAQVDFDYIFRALGSSFFQVEYSSDGGGTWTEILNETATTGGAFAGAAVPFSAAIPDADATATFQLRFTYDDGDGWNWYAGFDNLVISAAAAVTPINDFNGTADASGVYPVGTTTVTFTVQDAFGNDVTCTTDVTVVDDEAPVFSSCPQDMTVNLDPGACDAVISFDVLASDNCPTSFPATSLDLAQPAAFTGTGQAGVMFDLENTSAQDAQVEGFDINLQNGTWTIQVYSTASASTYVGNLNNGTAGASNANWTFAGEVTLTGNTGGITNVPLGFLLPAGSTKGVYVTSTVSIGGGPISYGINTGGNVFTDGVLEMRAGMGQTAIPAPFAGGTFGTPGSPSANYRVLKGSVVYSLITDDIVTPSPANQFASGDAFPIGGPYNLTYTATDLAGNTSVCSFNVTVNENVVTNNAMTCNSLVHVTVDENCQAVVGADQILEGDQYGCYDNYQVLFDDGPNAGQPLIVGAGNVGDTIKVRVVSPQGIPCWGYILVEDKNIPDLDCQDVTIGCDDPTAPGSVVAATIDYAVAPITSQDNNTVTETVMVDAGTTVSDLNVTIESTHTWVGDLTISVTSPSGTVVTLIDRPGLAGTPPFGCNNTTDMMVVLDDEAAATYADLDAQCPPVGTFQPNEALSAFDGENAQGAWTVSVADAVGGDGGITDVTLSLKAAGSGTIPFPVPSTATVLPAGPNTYTVIGFDPCGPATLVYADAESGDICSNQKITRNWTITDGSGNSSACTQMINITPTTIADVLGDLPGDITLECGDALPAPLTDLGCDNIDVTLDGTPVVIDICDGSFKMLRKYVIVDWCTNETENFTQIIKVLDTQGPALTCPADMTVGTTSNACSGNVALPAPTATDCGGGVTMVPSIGEGSLNLNPNGVWTVSGLPTGTHTVTWTATDACGNESTCTLNVTVVDNIAPIAICDEHTIASLGTAFSAQNGIPNSPNGQPLALINAETFDDGSTDNCGIVSMLARRMDNPNCIGFDGTAFGPTVPFYCCDLGSVIMVEFQVRDAAGNTNSCMVEVEVQDKIDPILVCPAPKTINCDDDPLNLGLTGEATATDNCSNVTPSFTDISNTVDCGAGTILRLWTVSDDATPPNSTSCIQTITVVKTDPFTIVDTECRRFFPINNNPIPTGPHSSQDDVEWPCDIELTTCGQGLEPDDLAANGNTNPVTGQQVSLDARPAIFEGACDNVAMTHQDIELEFGAGDACLKILRKWIIIDWCQAGANQDPTQPGPGVWHYTQVIKVVNSNLPMITPVSLPAVVENFDANCGGVFSAFEITADDDCTAQSDLDVTHEFFRLVMVAPGVYDEVFLSGGTGFAASDVLANGKYRLKYAVNDQCGNEAPLVHDFEVVDAKKPTPICTFGLSTVTMPNSGAVDVWASDFESGSSYDNCTPYNALQISFSTDVNDILKTITCADIPADGLVPITIYVTDAAGNFDFCSTFVKVESAPGVCPIVASTIAGTIENENQEVIEDVTVSISGSSSGMTNTYVTGSNGYFEFTGLANDMYEVAPEKDINYLNGVTTYDLVLISKHILGTEVFDSPYKWIAADANNSETITTLDIVKFRALILHIDDELANNTSWRFVDTDYAFSTNNPLTEDYPQTSDIEMTGVAMVGNFTAVKIGDVNHTAIPNSLLGTDTRTFNGKLALQLEAAQVTAGEEFTVDFRAKDFNNIAGYQFTLGFDNSVVEFVDVTSNLSGLSTENFGLTKLNEGVITTSWNANKGVSVDNDAVLFSMTFKATGATNVEDVLSINSRYTASEAYNGSDLFDVVLEFNGTEVSNGFELYQNTPNPFKEMTTIGFNITEASEVTLKVFDVAGRVLTMVKMDAAKGYNSVDINRADLDATGVLYYQVETATETATKKMIIVD